MLKGAPLRVPFRWGESVSETTDAASDYAK